MNLSELCQFIESVQEPILPSDEPNERARKLGVKLSEIEDIPIPIELPGKLPSVAFVIEDLDITLVKLIQRARSAIELESIPVILATCAECECEECEVTEELAEAPLLLTETTILDGDPGETKVLKVPMEVEFDEEPVVNVPALKEEIVPDEIAELDLSDLDLDLEEEDA